MAQTKKKEDKQKSLNDELLEDEATDKVNTPKKAAKVAEKQEVAKEAKQPFEKPYDHYLWKGLKEKKVYYCKSCKVQDDKESEMIMHVLTHYSEEQRDEILDKLV